MERNGHSFTSKHSNYPCANRYRSAQAARPRTHKHAYTHTHFLSKLRLNHLMLSQFMESSHRVRQDWVSGFQKSEAVDCLKGKGAGGRGGRATTPCWKKSGGKQWEEKKWRDSWGPSHTSQSLTETEVRNSTLLRHLLSFGPHQCLFQYRLPPETRGKEWRG